MFNSNYYGYHYASKCVQTPTNVLKVLVVVLNHVQMLLETTPALVDLAIYWLVMDTHAMVSLMYYSFHGYMDSLEPGLLLVKF